MKLIGKSKITKHRPKKDIIYPIIRLPQSNAHITGETAHIFETEHNGKPFFVISLEEGFDGNVVVQPNNQTDVESRLSALEDQVKNLEKSTPEEDKRSGGPAGIRIQDLRRVKATS